MCLCATGHWYHPYPAGDLWASRPCIAPWNDSPGAACTTSMAGSVRAFGTLKYLGIAVPSCTSCKYTGWDHSQDQSSMSIGQSLWGFMDRWTPKSRRSCVHKDLQSHRVPARKRNPCIQDTSQARGSTVSCRPSCVQTMPDGALAMCSTCRGTMMSSWTGPQDADHVASSSDPYNICTRVAAVLRTISNPKNHRPLPVLIELRQHHATILSSEYSALL